MKFASVVLALMLGVYGSAMAHPDHDDEPVPTMHAEASKSAGGVLIQVTDRGAKVPTAGATGKLVWFGASKGEAVLQALGVNGMEAKGVKPAAGSRGQAIITFADKNVVVLDVVLK